MSELYHYGTPRHSGRYPWGSGKNPQRNKTFLQRAKELEAQGLSQTEVAKAFGMSTTKYRAMHSIAVNERRKEEQLKAQKLKDKGWSNTAIAKELGRPESTIRNYLNPVQQERATATEKLAGVLKAQIEDKPYLDVGKGVNRQLGVTDTQLKTAIELLRAEGYNLYSFKTEQVTNPGQYTEMKVLTKGDVSYKDMREHQTQITSPSGVYFEDYGDVVRPIRPPVSINSDRIEIKYHEQGGSDKDGVIELRKGVPDISLGQSQYAQVRIAVDGSHYLKGMAMYSDDLPPGVDIRFNTNKHEGTPKMDVLKSMKDDPSNPFGAVTRQMDYIGSDGKEHQSAINIVNDDTDWNKWSKNLSSQFLSKQSPVVAKQQLALTYKQKEDEFKDICELTNPTVKRKLLESFAEDCDSSAVHLKAAAFPRQATHVILPIGSLKDTECYAPNYKTGEEVVLVRFPHAGTFEIPRLTVNNNNPEGKSLLGQAAHAIGINSHVAQQLSGADFDGDTVVVIPTAGQNIRSSSPLKQLKDFDPKEAYPAYPGMPKVGPETKFHKGTEMGKVSNLITDMTIKGASSDEIARAVKHSMVVIDAEKHNLDWQRSYRENGIKELQDIYQAKEDGGRSGGASTLISRAKSDARIPERKEITNLSKMTPEQRERYKNGERIFVDTGEYHEKTVIGKNGERTKVLKPNLTKTTKMDATDDAFTLTSGTGNRMETVYAEHANRLKALANEARKELRMTGRLQMNPWAREAYKEEVASLKAKLNIAAKNSPLERQAQLIAAKIMQAKIAANPDWEKDDIKKHRQIELDTARYRVGSKSRKKLAIEITDREWEAIQAGAISDSTLSEILRYTDTAAVQKRATPRATKGMSATAKSRARVLLNQGKTQAEVAEAVGVSVSTLRKELDGV